MWEIEGGGLIWFCKYFVVFSMFIVLYLGIEVFDFVFIFLFSEINCFFGFIECVFFIFDEFLIYGGFGGFDLLLFFSCCIDIENWRFLFLGLFDNDFLFLFFGVVIGIWVFVRDIYCFFCLMFFRILFFEFL